MIRNIAIILAVLNFVEPHRWCDHHPQICRRHHHDYKQTFRQDDRFFEKLANDVIELNRRVNSICTEDQEISRREMYDGENYKLITTLPHFNEDKIAVKIKHHVLYVKAESDADNKKYMGIKILPDIVNTNASTWYYDSRELYVVIPYKLDSQTEIYLSCAEEGNDSVIIVPKSVIDPNAIPETYKRMAPGNDAEQSIESTSENVAQNVVY